jgi:hypothetical protein
MDGVFIVLTLAANIGAASEAYFRPVQRKRRAHLSNCTTLGTIRKEQERSIDYWLKPVTLDLSMWGYATGNATLLTVVVVAITVGAVALVGQRISRARAEARTWRALDLDRGANHQVVAHGAQHKS